MKKLWLKVFIVSSICLLLALVLFSFLVLYSITRPLQVEALYTDVDYEELNQIASSPYLDTYTALSDGTVYARFECKVWSEGKLWHELMFGPRAETYWITK